MRARLALLLPLLALTGCGAAVKYGDVQHSKLAEDPKCNPAQTDGQAIAGKDFFLATSRSPDCRNGGMKLTGIAEVFNVTNHANYGAYNAQLNSTTFGDPRQNLLNAYQPRVMQLAAKFSF